MTDPPEVYPPDQFTVITCVSDEEVYQANMATSEPILSGRMKHHIVRGVMAVPRAFNEAVSMCDTPYVVLAHQDVKLPQFWDHFLQQNMWKMEDICPHWMMLGPAGAVPAVSVKAGTRGMVWTHGEEVGSRVDAPMMVQTLDECCVIMRPEEVWFPENNPSHHFFAAEFALSNAEHCYAIDAPVHHNMTHPAHEVEFGSFLPSAGWLWAIHWEKAPIQTNCCRMLNRNGVQFIEL